jgi:hypothetical protein
MGAAPTGGSYKAASQIIICCWDGARQRREKGTNKLYVKGEKECQQKKIEKQ